MLLAMLIVYGLTAGLVVAVVGLGWFFERGGEPATSVRLAPAAKWSTAGLLEVQLPSRG